MAIDTSAPALVPFATHVEAVERASQALARHAGQTWLGAPVPTCPDWDVLDLVAHQGMVHRWATAALHDNRDAMGNADLMETEGRTSTDPIAWFTRGAEDLTAALRSAPEDLEALVFLKNPPAPRDFWARRQCHETTVHALDALSATTGRPEVTAEEARSTVGVDADLALDGIDELLLGFFPRSRTRIRSTSPYAVHLLPDDAPVSWVVEVGEEPVRSRRLTAQESIPDAALVSGSAIDLYLALWNRGGSVHDPDGVLDRWREDGAVRW